MIFVEDCFDDSDSTNCTTEIFCDLSLSKPESCTFQSCFLSFFSSLREFECQNCSAFERLLYNFTSHRWQNRKILFLLRLHTLIFHFVSALLFLNNLTKKPWTTIPALSQVRNGDVVSSLHTQVSLEAGPNWKDNQVRKNRGSVLEPRRPLHSLGRL